MRILPVIVYLIVVLFYLPAPVTYAQYDPAAITGTPSCDLCGGCRDADNNVTQPRDWEQCRQCIYGTNEPSQPIAGKTWTPVGCVSSDVGEAGGFVQTVLRFVIGIAGGLAFLGFLWGGFQLLTSAGDPLRIASGKNTILAAAGALILIIFAVFLLQFIGFSILGIPGFGE